MKNEKSVKNKVLKEMRDRGWHPIATHNTYRKGVPDICLCLPPDGRFVYIELKHLKKSQNKLHHPLTVPQSLTLRNLNSDGGIGIVAIYVEEKQKFLVEYITEPGKKTEFKWDNANVEDLCQFLLNTNKSSEPGS